MIIKNEKKELCFLKLSIWFNINNSKTVVTDLGNDFNEHFGAAFVNLALVGLLLNLGRLMVSTCFQC